MGKKKSSREIIESEKNPDLEHAYVKYPGEEMKEVTLVNTEDSVWSNPFKVFKLWMQHNKRKYSDIHTHPGNWTALPSYGDIYNFLTNSHAKSMIIFAPSDEWYGHYFVIKKTKKTPKSLLFLDSIRAFFGLHPLLKSYEQTMRKGYVHDIVYPSTRLKDIAERYELNYKMVPYEKNSRNSLGIRLFNEFGRPTFFKKKTKLEGKIATVLITISSFIIGLFLISSDFSNNIQLSPGGNNFFGNWRLLIGGVLFVIGLISGFFWFRKRNS